MIMSDVVAIERGDPDNCRHPRAGADPGTLTRWDPSTAFHLLFGRRRRVAPAGRLHHRGAESRAGRSDPDPLLAGGARDIHRPPGVQSGKEHWQSHWRPGNRRTCLPRNLIGQRPGRALARQRFAQHAAPHVMEDRVEPMACCLSTGSWPLPRRPSLRMHASSISPMWKMKINRGEHL